MRSQSAAIRIVFGLLVAGDACADSYDDFVREQPPCHLAPLTDQQVMDAAWKELGESYFHVPGMPERPYRIATRGCAYEVEYVILSHGQEWFGFDAIDGTSFILVARDHRVWRPPPIVVSNH